MNTKKDVNSLRVAMIHGVIAPYRHLLFEELSQKMDLVVYYCSMISNLRSWELWPRNYDYEYYILPKIPLGKLYMNPTIIKELILKRYDALILGGYIDPTMWLAFSTAKLLKIPIIYWTEGIKEPDYLILKYYSNINSDILGRVSRPIRKFFINKANAIIVPGKLSGKYVIDMGADKSKVFIAPNCIDNDLFINYSFEYRKAKDTLKKELGIVENLIILYVGRLSESKGIDYLMKAYTKLKRHHDVALVVIGSGPLRRQLGYDEIAGVYFTESQDRYINLIKYYSVADIFVLPTLYDCWGFVINEAMACGLPVVATRASQAALEMIHPGENGLIIKEADVDELFEALKKLVYDVELRQRMAKQSREIVMNKFDVKHMVSGFVQAINYAIARRYSR